MRKTTVGFFFSTTSAPRPGQPVDLRRVGGLPGFDPVAGRDDVVVVAFVDEAAELAQFWASPKPPWGRSTPM